MSDPFTLFRGFGGSDSFFRGRDPFDDPFFSRPFGSLLGSDAPGVIAPSVGTKGSDDEKGLLIEELVSEGEESNGKTDKDRERMISEDEPYVEHPEDEDHAEGLRRNMKKRSSHNKVGTVQSEPQTFSYHTRKVTYGGVDGTYYTSSRTRRAGCDGVVMEESKQADISTGQATHRISRGIHDKGLSLTRNLNADGKIDTTHTLHNLKEDELLGFEEAWKGHNFRDLSPGSVNKRENNGSGNQEQNQRVNRERLLPSSRNSPRNNPRLGACSSRSGAKKVVRINIE